MPRTPVTPDTLKLKRQPVTSPEPEAQLEEDTLPPAARDHYPAIADALDSAENELEEAAARGLDPADLVEELKRKVAERDAADAQEAQAQVKRKTTQDHTREWKEQQAATVADMLAGSGVEVNLGEVKPKEVDWIWKDRLARGKLTLIAGDPAVSKSTIALDIGARISNGREWPDHSGSAPKGTIILLTAEDDLADTVRPRVDALIGTAKAFTVLQAVKVMGEERQFSLVHDLDVLEASILKHKPVVVIIDTVNSYLGTPGAGVKVDTFKDADVRDVLLPLMKLAEKHHVAVIGIMHLNKSAAQTKALYRVLGSIGYTGAARLVLIAGKDPEDATGRRYFFVGAKNSNGPEAAPLAYERDGNAIRWSRDPVDPSRKLDGDALLAGGLSKEDRGAVDDAEAFIVEALKDGPVSATQMRADAKANEVSASALKRAKHRLKVRSIHLGRESEWVWDLPSKRRPV
jgi:RecA-family ATPase